MSYRDKVLALNHPGMTEPFSMVSRDAAAEIAAQADAEIARLRADKESPTPIAPDKKMAEPKPPPGSMLPRN